MLSFMTTYRQHGDVFNVYKIRALNNVTKINNQNSNLAIMAYSAFNKASDWSICRVQFLNKYLNSNGIRLISNWMKRKEKKPRMIMKLIKRNNILNQSMCALLSSDSLPAMWMLLGWKTSLSHSARDCFKHKQTLECGSRRFLRLYRRVMWSFGSEGFLRLLSKCPFDLELGLDGGNTSNSDIEGWTKKEDRANQSGRGKGVIVSLKCQWCHPALIMNQQRTASSHWTNRVTTEVECGTRERVKFNK